MKEPHLNKLNDMGGRMSYVFTAEIAEQESKSMSDRILIKQKALRASGSFVGKVSYGYEIITTTDRDGKAFKTLAPRDGEAQVIARIFEDVANGTPVSRVASALESEGIRTRRGLPFSEKVTHDIIANPAYRGLVTYRGHAYMTVMPLVSAAMWQAANHAVKGRVQSRARDGKRVSAGRPQGTQAALLRPVCGVCGGPMYRYSPKDHPEWASYRCAGIGPNGTSALRKGCGNTIKADLLDSEVTEDFLSEDDLEVTEIFAPGTDYTEDIAREEPAIRDLDLDADDYDEKHAALRSELKRLKGLPVQAPSITVRATGRTEGEAYAAMNPRSDVRTFGIGNSPFTLRAQSRADGSSAEAPDTLLRGAGFDPDMASAIARSALWTGIMLVMSEPGAAWLTDDERIEAQRKKQVGLASLPPAKYPRLVECAVPMTACDDPDQHYEFGVRLFIGGVQAIAADGACDHRR